MYRVENPMRREGRLRHERESPSFSSSLLDKIYRSIDDGEKRSDDLRFFRETMAKKQSNINNNSNRGAKKDDEDESLASFRRACLIEKWMEKKVEEKAVSQRRREQERNHFNDMNDALFFSSTSSSSDSSSGGFSSSDTDSMFGAVRSAAAASSSSWPKPVRTSAAEKKQRNDVVVADDETLIKSKSRALKIYNNLKKVKQPISPGGRLASFINNLFASSGGAKKPAGGKAAKAAASFQEPSTATCSSASSFSRSCLSKSSPSTRERLRSTSGVKRSVRFYPVSVIVDEDSRPCGHKSLHVEERRQESVLVPLSVPTAWKIGRSPARKAEEAELKARGNSEKARRVEETAREFLRDYRQNQIKNELIIMRDQFRGKGGDDHGHDHHEDVVVDDDDNDDDDTASYSSSDLFELDHLAVIGKEVRYQEELPVYETTRVDRNRAIF